ncbi:MAG: hydroxysqualene dehydroxylase HpnE, partial [Thermoguttaceae bacterium]
MGCCTNFLDFVRRTGVEDCFERHRRLTFVGPAGERCAFGSWRWLPAPLHLAPGFARMKYLSLGERLDIGRCLMRLGRLTPDTCRGQTSDQWLRGQGQSQTTIDLFWSTVLVSALGEIVERADLWMSRKVFVDGFLRAARGYELILPKIPLGQIVDGRVGGRLQELGVKLHLASTVRSLELPLEGPLGLVLAGGERFSFDALVLATAWTGIDRILSPEQQGRLVPGWAAHRLRGSAIAAVHLWFDRPITTLAHAAFAGRTSQWIFRHTSGPADSGGPAGGHRYQVVISASDKLARLPKAELLEKVLWELGELFPSASSARLLHHRIVTEPGAVFSITPEAEGSRPATETGIPNVYLAGDWTGTGWPATMEGAILSGYRAAAMILRKSGREVGLPLDGLPPGWLARMLFSTS